MGQTEPTRQSDEILPPISGSTARIAVTNAATTVDLTTFPQTAVLTTKQVKGSENTNPLGQYLNLQPDGACNVLFAATQTTAAAISTSSTSTVSGAGVITIAGTESLPMTAGIVYQFRMPPGPTSDVTGTTGAVLKHGSQSPARWMGLIAGANTTLTVWVSSK